MGRKFFVLSGNWTYLLLTTFFSWIRSGYLGIGGGVSEDEGRAEWDSTGVSEGAIDRLSEGAISVTTGDYLGRAFWGTWVRCFVDYLLMKDFENYASIPHRAMVNTRCYCNTIRFILG
jgi:hypothetical protein